MGRIRQQSVTDTLDVCRDLFWQRGYSRTSIKDIERATELRTASVYHHFKDKQTLFEQSLDHYIETVIRPRTEHFLFTNQGNARENILGFFNAVLKISKNHRYGCMAVNTAIDAPNLDGVQNKLESMIELLETGFLFQLNRVEVSSPPPNWDTSIIASQLVLMNQGFWSMVRINGSNLKIRKHLSAISRLIN